MVWILKKEVALGATSFLIYQEKIIQQ